MTKKTLTESYVALTDIIVVPIFAIEVPINYYIF